MTNVTTNIPPDSSSCCKSSVTFYYKPSNLNTPVENECDKCKKECEVLNPTTTKRPLGNIRGTNWGIFHEKGAENIPIKLHDCTKEYSGYCGVCRKRLGLGDAPPLYTDHDTENYVKIVEWLYSNHEAYGSAKEWRKAFVKFLKEILL